MNYLKINKKSSTKSLKEIPLRGTVLPEKKNFLLAKKLKKYIHQLLSSDKILPTSNQPHNTKIDTKTKEKLKNFVEIN